MKTTYGGSGERERELKASALWLTAHDLNEMTRGHFYVTHASPESIEPTTLCGIRIGISEAMPRNVALLLPSPLRSLKPLRLNMDTCKAKGVIDTAIYRLIDWTESKGIILVTLE